MIIQWTKTLTDRFIDEALLNEEEAYILRSRIKGKTVVELSVDLHKSEATVNREIKRIKNKYDVVQKEYPDVFPLRNDRKKSVT